MQMRIVLLKLATVGAVAAASLAPAAAQAQTANKGQLVQAVAKLHQSQLAFVRKLADDPTFAKQYEDAMSSGNYDAVESLVALASGASKSSIHAGPLGSAANGISNPGYGYNTPVRYASVTGHEAPRAMGPGVICFNLGIIYGCMSFK
jgi:hypothetical protein